MMKNILAAAIVALAGAAQAAPVSWVDWTQSTSNGATGTVTVGSNTIGVTFGNSVSNSFVRTEDVGNYWTTPTTYTSTNCSAGALCADNAPPASDIIALSAGGTRTITFSQAVQNIYIAFISWNGNVGTFSDPIQLLSIGPGYWGSGTVAVAGNVMTSTSGEPHGTLLMPGARSSFSFTTGSESWHGFTVGVAGVPPTGVVPLPAAGWLLLGGLGSLAALRRRRPAA
jgi:hypothetical protein